MSKKMILLESDKDIVAELSDYLLINQYEADVYSDGEQAIKKVISSKTEVDVVVIDSDSCYGREKEYIRWIKSRKIVPVIVLSSKNDEMSTVDTLLAGADDYVAKPFRYGELIARIRTHTVNYEKVVDVLLPEEAIECGGLRIEPRKRRVFVDNKEVKLCQKEFELLLYLAKTPGVIHLREDIYRDIWGMDSVGNMATLTVHIKNLRMKIEPENSSDKYIETIWKAGYRFRVQKNEK